MAGIGARSIPGDPLDERGDRVAAFWRISGRHVGMLFGIPGSDKEFTVNSISRLTIRDGQIAEYDVQADLNAFREAVSPT